MKLLIIIFAAVTLLGCAGVRPGHKVSTVLAVVKAFDEPVPLEVTSPSPNVYLASLEIVEPYELSGAQLQVMCERPLDKEHLFRLIGAHVNLSVEDLQSHRGSSQVGEHDARVLYYFYFREIKGVSKTERIPDSRRSGLPQPTRDAG